MKTVQYSVSCTPQVYKSGGSKKISTPTFKTVAPPVGKQVVTSVLRR